MVYKNKKIDNILRKYTFLKRIYFLEKNSWDIIPNFTSTKYQVYDGNIIVIEIESQLTLKNEKYDVKVFNEKRLYLCALIVLSTILLNHKK